MPLPLAAARGSRGNTKQPRCSQRNRRSRKIEFGFQICSKFHRNAHTHAHLIMFCDGMNCVWNPKPASSDIVYPHPVHTYCVLLRASHTPPRCGMCVRLRTSLVFPSGLQPFAPPKTKHPPTQVQPLLRVLAMPDGGLPEGKDGRGAAAYTLVLTGAPAHPRFAALCRVAPPPQSRTHVPLCISTISFRQAHHRISAGIHTKRRPAYPQGVTLSPMHTCKQARHHLLPLAYL